MPRLEQELIAHAAALRALARDLVSGSDADDLLQDTALQALQAERRSGTSLLAFFSTIVRRLASRHRRGQRRRLAREQLAARDEAAPPVDAQLIRDEMLRRLTAAMLALPEPYRGTLQQRYYENRKPAAIAAYSGVPLATVKSRLQRGLQILRERLERDGDDWRPALALAFGLAEMAATTTGVLAMGIGMKLAAGVAAAAVAVAAGSWFLTEQAPTPTHPITSARNDPVLATGDVDFAAKTAQVQVERRELPVAQPPAAGAIPRASMHGRCVDGDGQPLAEVAVSLRGMSRDGIEPVRAWEQQHGTLVQWRDQQATTGPDGTFAFAFDPPSLYRFDVLTRLPGFVDMTASWSNLDADAALDLGDVVLSRGAEVRGRVVDTAGMPVARVMVHPVFDPEASWAGAGAFRPSIRDRAETAADGRFTLPERQPPGPHELQVEQQVLANGARYAVAPDAGDVDLELVVLRAEERQTIEGVVVDQYGAPVVKVGVHAMSGPGGSGMTPYTDANGHFVVTRRPNQEEDPSFWIMASGGCEELRTEETYAWGQRDVRLVMHRGVTVEVQVLTADSGLPVESFSVRMFLQPGVPENQDKGSSSLDYEVRASGHHDGGIARIDGIARGPQLIYVQPDDPDLAASSLVPFEVREPGPVRVIVHLQRTARRQVRVHFPDGKPVAGAAIRVVDTLGREFGQRTCILPMEQLGQVPGPDRMLLVMATTTDAQGMAVVRAASNHRVLLDLPGPGLVPSRVADVVLEATDPLDVCVARGGRLVGTATPLDLVRDLRRSAGMPAHGSGQTDPYLGGMLTAGFTLQRGEGARRERFPADFSLPPSMPETDGTFGFDGVPPGTWQLVLQTGSQNHTYPSGPVATVTMVEGESTKVTVDLSRLAPATLDALVLHNGHPLANAELLLSCHRQGGYSDSLKAETDGDGRFSVRLAAGTFELMLRRDAGDGTTLYLRAQRAVEVSPGSTANPTFHIDTGTLRLRLLDAQGRPIAGVPLRLLDPDGRERHVLPKTDAQGLVTCELDTGSFTVSVLPRRLLDDGARHLYINEHPGTDPFAAVRLPLGEVQVTRGSPTAAELHLPTGW